MLLEDIFNYRARVGQEFSHDMHLSFGKFSNFKIENIEKSIPKNINNYQIIIYVFKLIIVETIHNLISTKVADHIEEK